jgi:hypothetical protein
MYALQWPLVPVGKLPFMLEETITAGMRKDMKAGLVYGIVQIGNSCNAELLLFLF